ncbi:MAG TPA: hypothetical protein VMS17_33425, partial [Gemmataceae bacterium]|nr:hypothetical protein [Gemmataceae bacterium]
MVRRMLLLSLGVLECLVAIVLFGFAVGMPGAGEVHDGVSRIDRVTKKTSRQVAQLREALHLLREQRPKLRALADNLRNQMDGAVIRLKDPAVDYAAAESTARAMGDMAKGLDGLSTTFQADGVHRMSQDFKDAAVQLEACRPLLGADAEKYSQLLREAETRLAKAAEHWPELGPMLVEAARLLRVGQAQMQTVLANRDEYEQA